MAEINNKKKKVGHWCSVPGCKFDKRSSVHRFPKDPKLRKHWQIVCRIGKPITSNMGVCSAHFKRDDYMPRLNPKHPQFCKNKIIIPSLNLQNRPLDKVLTDSQLEQIENRKERLRKRQTAKVIREKLDDKKIEESIRTETEESNSESDIECNISDNTSDITEDMSCLPSCSTNNDSGDLNFQSNPVTASDGVEQQCDDFSDSDDEQNKSINKINHISEELHHQCEPHSYSDIEAAKILLELQTKLVDSNDKKVIGKSEVLQSDFKNKNQLNLMQLVKTDDDLKIFTGINFQLLRNLTNAVKACEKKRNLGSLTIEERIVLCFCKLKLNISFKCLAVLFSITRQSASNIFLVTIHTLAFILKKSIYWPTKQEIMKSMPKCFKKFRDTYIVLDCTEIPLERPKCLRCRLRVYSHYKGGETVKLLIGISPSGLIIYISEPFGGRASDKVIFKHSKILEKLEPTRDAIMVDKGFSIEEECALSRIKLYVPPKLSKNNQLSVNDVTSTVEIASARIHVERVIQRMKQFQILKSKISLKIAPYMTEISTVICGIVNLSNSILADNKF